MDEGKAQEDGDILPGTDKWKEFVANAVAKPPSRRTAAERKAIAYEIDRLKDDDARTS